MQRLRQPREQGQGGRSLVPGPAKVALAAVVVVVALGLFWSLFTERVNATESCVVTDFGREVGAAGPGIHLTRPGRSFHCFTVSRRTMELVAGEPSQSNSRADYVDYAIRARTKDGIDLYSMLTAQYHVDAGAVADLYPLIRDDEGVKEQIVKARLRAIVPQTLSNYSAEEQYLGNLGRISDDIETKLRAELAAQGVTLDYFELKRGDFDDTYEQAIRDKAAEIERANKKKLEQETARQEAERQRIEAEGNAAKARTEADAAAYRTVTDAEARAKAETAELEARAAAISANPELIEWERIQAISNAGAIYLPSGTLPIAQVPLPTPSPAAGQ